MAPPKDQRPNDGQASTVSSAPTKPVPRPSQLPQRTKGRPKSSVRLPSSQKKKKVWSPIPGDDPDSDAYIMCPPRQKRLSQSGQVPQRTQDQAEPDVQPVDHQKNTHESQTPTSSDEPASHSSVSTEPTAAHSRVSTEPQTDICQPVPSENLGVSGSQNSSHARHQPFGRYIRAWFGMLNFKVLLIVVVAIFFFARLLQAVQDPLPDNVDASPRSIYRFNLQKDSTLHAQVLKTIDVLESYPDEPWKDVLVHLRPLSQQHAKRRKTLEQAIFNNTLALARAAHPRHSQAAECRNAITSHLNAGISAASEAERLEKEAASAFVKARSVFDTVQETIRALETEKDTWLYWMDYHFRRRTSHERATSIPKRLDPLKKAQAHIVEHFNAADYEQARYEGHLQSVSNDLQGIKLFYSDRLRSAKPVFEKANTSIYRWIENDNATINTYNAWLSDGDSQSCGDLPLEFA